MQLRNGSRSLGAIGNTLGSSLHDPRKFSWTARQLSANRPWSRDEYDKLLTLKGKGKTYVQIAESLPGRTVRAIEHRVSQSPPGFKHRSQSLSWTADEDSWIRELLKAGRHLNSLSQFLPGRTSKAISNRYYSALKDPGLRINRKRRYRAWTEEETAQLIQWRTVEHKSLVAIARLLDVTYEQIRHKARKCIDAHTRYEIPRIYKTEHRQQIIDLLHGGYTQQAIANRLKVPFGGLTKFMFNTPQIVDVMRHMANRKSQKQMKMRDSIVEKRDAGSTWSELLQQFPEYTQQQLRDKYYNFAKRRIPKSDSDDDPRR